MNSVSKKKKKEINHIGIGKQTALLFFFWTD